MSAYPSRPRQPTAALANLVRPLRSILALADFSPKSDNAVARAALLAREHGAGLQLLHVVAPPRPAAVPRRRRNGGDQLQLAIDRAGRALATLAARIAQVHGVVAQCRVRTGDALQAILEEARGADLVVVAAKRPNPLRDFVLRTPTERLLRILQRPMLVVKRPVLGRYTELHVPAAGASRGGILVEPASRRATDPREELVVVAKDGHVRMATFLLGTLAQRLVAHAACDVLILPKAATGTIEHAHARGRHRDRGSAVGASARVRPKPAS